MAVMATPKGTPYVVKKSELDKFRSCKTSKDTMEQIHKSAETFRKNNLNSKRNVW